MSQCPKQVYSPIDQTLGLDDALKQLLAKILKEKGTKKMSQYSKQQEDRVERKLKVIGFKLVEDTARRKKHKGDRVMIHEDTGVTLCIDHKSTRGEKQIALLKEQFEKIAKESEAGAVPALTFSFRNSRNVYIAFNIKHLEGIMY